MQVWSSLFGQALSSDYGGLFHKGCLIKPQGSHLAETVRVVNEGCSIGQDSVIDGVPVAPKLSGHLVDAATSLTNGPRHIAPSPVSHLAPRCSDSGVLFGP